MNNSTKVACAIIFLIAQYSCATSPAQKQETGEQHDRGIARPNSATSPAPQKQEAADLEALALTQKGKEGANPEVLALTEKGKEALKAGKFDDSLRLLNEAYAKARKLKDGMGEAITLQALASLFGEVGDTQQMLKCFRQALAICKAREEKLFEASILVNMGEVYRQIGQPQEALEHYQQALKVSETIDNEQGKFLAAYAKGLIEFVKRESK